MSSVHLAIAAIPVAIYLMMIGALRLRKRPLITTGWRDTLALGIAASGLVAIGPMQLFFPTQAAVRWHGWVWLALLALYFLALLMVLLSCKPRLIAYGMDDTQFRRTILDAARKADEHATWTGEILTLPSQGLQLANEPTGTARVHQVALIGPLNNLQAWLDLEKSFVQAGREQQCPRSAAGWPFVLGGMLLLAVALTPMISDPNAAFAQLKEFLNR